MRGLVGLGKEPTGIEEVVGFVWKAGEVEEFMFDHVIEKVGAE